MQLDISASELSNFARKHIAGRSLEQPCSVDVRRVLLKERFDEWLHACDMGLDREFEAAVLKVGARELPPGVLQDSWLGLATPLYLNKLQAPTTQNS